VLECGKSRREADADVAEAIDFLEFYGVEWLRLSKPKRWTGTGRTQPSSAGAGGITAVIAPWNFPLAIPTGMVSAALVTGNPVLFKPSERSPIMGQLLAECWPKRGSRGGAPLPSRRTGDRTRRWRSIQRSQR
jgi:RHH-type proline utilization regulon transcriptional repressor/proline dehydrogenase/delta 1-pyrroline-5-carboxylate dehydrogenase